ncbi:MAG: hypothetical protein PHH93_00425 [Prolixibacteraceae bacterium]|nr:hypothetical protein [Prolixibacteraceae bacterium]
MTKEMILSKITGLQSNNIKFSAEANAFLGNAYTSMAGNHYFNAVRFGEGIIIKEDIGHGYKYTFLNGLRVYSIKEKKLIADASFHCQVYNKDLVRNKVTSMLIDKLNEAAEQQGFSFNDNDAKWIVKQIVEQAFVVDQRALAEKQLKRLTE